MQDSNIEDQSGSEINEAPVAINEQLQPSTTPALFDSEKPGDPKANSPKRKPWPFVVLFVVLLLVIGAAAYFRVQINKKSKIVDSSQSKPIVTKSQKPTGPFSVTKLANGDFKVADRTWFKKPVRVEGKEYTLLPADGLVNEYCNKDCKDPKDTRKEPAFVYDIVGRLDDGTDIVFKVGGQGPGTSEVLFLGKTGSYKVLKHYSPYLFNDSGKPNFDVYGANTSVDTSTTYSELEAPEKLTLKGQDFSRVSSNLQASSTLNDTPYATSDFGDLATETSKLKSTAYKQERFVLTLYSSSRTIYMPSPNISKIDKSEISFSDGSSNKDSTYSYGFHGCGYGNFRDTITDKSFEYVEVGKTNKGIQLFGFKDELDNPVIAEHYKSYDDFAKDAKDATYAPTLTLKQFIAKRPTVLFKDTLGQYVILYNDSTILAGGCGKPVIYLYPTSPTIVSVKVDADIRISVPAYNQGWNVLAFPNGKLFEKSGVFSSLYWEGYGHEYPEMTSGIVVSQNDLKTTIETNLRQLGLNAQESTDFQDFWLPKLPQTPYVRLTWFGTSQLNRLAPLNISPKPDTLIRIFLDFQGLQEPVTLPTQQLSSIPRKGFTVVEWGGLLQTPLPPKQ